MSKIEINYQQPRLLFSKKYFQGIYFKYIIYIYHIFIYHINVCNISNDIRAILTLTITNLGWQFQRQTPQFFWSRSVFQHITIPSSILTRLLWVKRVSSSRSSCQITKTTRSLGAFWAVASMWLAGRLLLTQTNTTYSDPSNSFTLRCI